MYKMNHVARTRHFSRAAFILPVFLGLSGQALALDVTIKNLRNQHGNVVVCIWRQADEGFPDCGNGKPFKKVAAPASAPRVSFPDLPPGDYAISMFHDEIKAGKPETNLVGIPTSGVGLANNPKLGMTSRPTFEKGLIHVPQAKDLAIEAQYLF